jgi:hypothetical protein
MLMMMVTGTASGSAQTAPAHERVAIPCYVHPQWYSPSCTAIVGFPLPSSQVLRKIHYAHSLLPLQLFFV